jgi:hypothetical protein
MYFPPEFPKVFVKLKFKPSDEETPLLTTVPDVFILAVIVTTGTVVSTLAVYEEISDDIPEPPTTLYLM